MKYKIVVEKRAAKFIRKQQPAQQKRIIEALAQLPFIGDIKPMAGMGGFYRLIAVCVSNAQATSANCISQICRFDRHYL